MHKFRRDVIDARKVIDGCNTGSRTSAPFGMDEHAVPACKLGPFNAKTVER
ncbi:predicted protein [Botrytis cinerea T4]|uniref:Uncharacterized protein n=1 Tax=Botryotinia fuckeliana (strain T4) TaxID=999810 RepID=G2YPY8_BOTF4|nr:predicted protein [Botrytis cinerea T4]